VKNSKGEEFVTVNKEDILSTQPIVSKLTIKGWIALAAAVIGGVVLLWLLLVVGSI
jgi:hypothetical protein